MDSVDLKEHRSFELSEQDYSGSELAWSCLSIHCHPRYTVKERGGRGCREERTEPNRPRGGKNKRWTHQSFSFVSVLTLGRTQVSHTFR